MIIEYAVMFVAIVAVVIYAAFNVMQPAVNRLLNTSAKIIDCSTNAIESQY
jgi:Flp pilus assembly pilin Flp